MSTQNIRLDGFIGYWNLTGDSALAALEKGLSDMDMLEFLPKAMTPKVALRKSLEILCRNTPTETMKVIPVKGRGGLFTVTKVTRNEHGGNKHENIVTGAVTRGIPMPFDGDDPSLPMDMLNHLDLYNDWQAVRKTYQNLRTTIPREQMMKASTGIVHFLNGTALKPDGGLYWLPKESLETWEKIGEVFHAASPGNRLHRFVVHMDNDALGSVIAGLQDEIVKGVSKTQERTEECSTPKGLNTVKENAKANLDKVRQYEKILGVALKDLVDLTQQAETSAASAHFAAQAAKKSA